MTITSIQYGRVVNLGNYENEKLSAWAAVEEGEAPEEALERLREWIENQAAHRAEIASATEAANERLLALVRQQNELESQVKQAAETWRKAKAFLQTVGLEMPREYYIATVDEEMPW